MDDVKRENILTHIDNIEKEIDIGFEYLQEAQDKVDRGITELQTIENRIKEIKQKLED